MPLSRKDDSFNIGLGGGGSTVQVTGVGFQPQWVFFWWSGRTESLATGRADVNKGYGMAVSPSVMRGVGVRQNDNFDTNGTLHDLRYHTSDNCIVSVDSDASPADTDGLAALQSFNADGFTLVINQQFALSLRVHYLALGGLDNVFIGTITEPGATGNQDITSPGFMPDSAIFFSVGLLGLPELGADSDLMFGAAAGATPSNVIQAGGGADNANGNPDRLRYVRQGECIAIPDVGLQIGGGNLNGRARVTDWLSNGLRLNWTERTAAQRLVFFTAFKGNSWGVGTLQTATSIQTIPISGLGFDPKFVMVGSGGGTAAESENVPTITHDMWTFGMGSGSPGRVHGGQNEKVASPSVCGTSVRDDAIYVHFASPPSTSDGRISLQSLDTDGFTLSQDDADPSSFFSIWWAGGDAGVILNRDALLPVEWSGLARDAKLPVHFLQTIRRDPPLPVEFRGLETRNRDASLPIQIKGQEARSRDAQLPVELRGLEARTRDAKLMFEALGIAASRDASLPFENTGISSDLLLHKWLVLIKASLPLLHFWNVRKAAQDFTLTHTWNVLEPTPPLPHRWNVTPDVATPFGFDINTGEPIPPPVGGVASGDIQVPIATKDKTP